MAEDAVHDEITRLRAALAAALAEQPELQAKLDAEKWAHAMTSRRLTFALEEVSALRDQISDRCVARGLQRQCLQASADVRVHPLPSPSRADGPLPPSARSQSHQPVRVARGQHCVAPGRERPANATGRRAAAQPPADTRGAPAPVVPPASSRGNSGQPLTPGPATSLGMRTCGRGVQCAALHALDRVPEAAVLATVVRQLNHLRHHLEQEETRLADCESHVQACTATPWVRLAQLTASQNTLPSALEEVEVRGSVDVASPPLAPPAMLTITSFRPLGVAMTGWPSTRPSCASTRRPMSVRIPTHGPMAARLSGWLGLNRASAAVIGSPRAPGRRAWYGSDRHACRLGAARRVAERGRSAAAIGMLTRRRTELQMRIATVNSQLVWSAKTGSDQRACVRREAWRG